MFLTFDLYVSLNQMNDLDYVGAPEAIDELYALANGLDVCVYSYIGCVVNGIKFQIENWDVSHKTQNSDIFVPSIHHNEEINFYSTILETLKFYYIKGCIVIMFKCKWFKIEPKNRRMQQDYNIMSINISSQWYKDELFILAS